MIGLSSAPPLLTPVFCLVCLGRPHNGVGLFLRVHWCTAFCAGRCRATQLLWPTPSSSALCLAQHVSVSLLGFWAQVRNLRLPSLEQENTTQETLAQTGGQVCVGGQVPGAGSRAQNPCLGLSEAVSQCELGFSSSVQKVELKGLPAPAALVASCSGQRLQSP